MPAIGSQKLASPTQLGEGNLNAVVISSSKGSSAAAQQSSRKLTIVRPWYASVS